MKFSLDKAPVKSTEQRYERFLKGLTAALETMKQDRFFAYQTTGKTLIEVILGQQNVLCVCGHTWDEHPQNACIGQEHVTPEIGQPFRKPCSCSKFKPWGFRKNV